MTDYVVEIRLKNVAEGDAKSLAQDVYDTHGEEFDAARGEFEVTISKHEYPGGPGFDVDWDPDDREAA
jgi:hypothetical protein